MRTPALPPASRHWWRSRSPWTPPQLVPCSRRRRGPRCSSPRPCGCVFSPPSRGLTPNSPPGPSARRQRSTPPSGCSWTPIRHVAGAQRSSAAGRCWTSGCTRRPWRTISSVRPPGSTPRDSSPTPAWTSTSRRSPITNAGPPRGDAPSPRRPGCGPPLPARRATSGSGSPSITPPASRSGHAIKPLATCGSRGTSSATATRYGRCTAVWTRERWRARPCATATRSRCSRCSTRSPHSWGSDGRG